MTSTEHQVMEVVIRSPGCTLEEIVLACNGLTWNQVFTQLDHMSRSGQIRLMTKGRGVYTVSYNHKVRAGERLLSGGMDHPSMLNVPVSEVLLAQASHPTIRPDSAIRIDAGNHNRET